MSDELKAYFDQVISEYSLDTHDDHFYTRINQFIQNSAEYSYGYSFPNDCEDLAYYFLTQSKKGVCQHYAMSAVLLYRYLGVPARYTTGFMVQSTADTLSTAWNTQAHAWVEVYINGCGWVPMEVTGSADMVYLDVDYEDQNDVYTGAPFAFDFSHPLYRYYVNNVQTELPAGYTIHAKLKDGALVGINPGDYVLSSGSYIVWVEDENGDKVEIFDYTTSKHDINYTITESDEKIDIIVKGCDREFDYDGTMHYALDNDVEVISGKLKAGHHVEATVTGSCRNPGQYTARVDKGSVVIKNEAGINVTFMYNITEIQNGTLTVREPNDMTLQPIYQGLYDGEWHYSVVDPSQYSGLHSNFEIVDITTTNPRREVGENASTISGYRVINKVNNNEDVTQYFEKHIKLLSGYVRILGVDLTIQAGSSIKKFDNTALTNDECIIASGELLPGHRLEVVTSGSITRVGSVQNALNDWHIYDEQDHDVTDCYNITPLPGELTIEPAKITITARDKTVTYNGSPVEQNNTWFKYVAGENNEFNKKLIITLEINQEYKKNHAENMSKVGTTGLIIDKNTIHIALSSDPETDVTDCFDINANGAVVNGKLTIKAVDLVLKPAYISFPYSGITYDESVLELEDYVLVGDDVLLYYEFEEVEIRYIGQVETFVDPESIMIVNGKGENVTNCYNIDTSEPGIIEIY